MKAFDQTRFFRLVAAVIYRLLPNLPARPLWCLFIVSLLLVQLIDIICSGSSWLLDNFTDNDTGYYCLVVVHTIRYGAWFWGFWYSFYQLARLGRPNLLITPQLISCSVTGGLLMYLLTSITELIANDHVLLIRGMLALAFAGGALLPTLWRPGAVAGN